MASFMLQIINLDSVYRQNLDGRWNRVSGSRVSGSLGQQFGSGSGRVTGQSPDPAFWPGFLFNVAVDIIEQDGSVTVHSAHLPTTHLR